MGHFSADIFTFIPKGAQCGARHSILQLSKQGRIAYCLPEIFAFTGLCTNTLNGIVAQASEESPSLPLF